MTLFTRIYKWLDGAADTKSEFGPQDRKVNWWRMLPFWALHLMCLVIIWVGFSWTALAVAVGLYVVRMFASTGWYHRYFSHRTFKTSRAVQFLFAAIGNSSAQRGALHWAAHHRHHHRFSDQPEDAHSPRQHGFWMSHLLWFSKKENSSLKAGDLKDFARYPELVFLDRFDYVAPLFLGAFTIALGWTLARLAPQLGTNGLQMMIWGYFVSTIALYHGTFSINSLGHLI